ncbi:MAG: DSC4 family protein, partial [Terriglobus roseus]|nr:DSC4 family protein [Terriglobus roseus]
MQLYYLTPKPPMLPTPPSGKDKPYIGAIIGTNLLCLILHLYLAQPAAGEATRGYLHGGLLIDFVGQKGPSSRWLLAALDVAIALLQLVMLAAVVEERELLQHQKRKRGRRRARATAAEQQQQQRRRRQSAAQDAADDDAAAAAAPP